MKKSKFLVLCLVLLVVALSISILVACDKGTDGNTNGKTPPNSGGKLLNGTFDGMVIKNGILTEYSGSATELVIPSGVTGIGADAFSGCSGLTSITIPDSVTSIGVGAFGGCSSLTSITIPNGVTGIGYEAFSGCSSLTSIIIPDSVTGIGSYAFSGCNKLQYEEYGNAKYLGNHLIKAATNDITTVDIKQGTKTIAGRAFVGCSGITSITIPAGVTSIGSAFENCSGLTNITIPDSVTSISGWAFDGCNKLQYEEYGNAKYLGNHLIKAATNDITTVDIKQGTKTIADRAFVGCSGLTSVNIPAGVTSIGAGAFVGCSGLTGITIPDSVTSIGLYVFSGCSGLTRIIVESGNTAYHSKGNCLIEKATKTLIRGCKNSVIPTDGSVIEIGEEAFNDINLKSIAIPNGVTSIGHNAFYGCSGLTNITIPDSVTSIGYGAFLGCSGLTINVRAASKPSGWDSDWNCGRPVNWGYKG